MKNLKQAVILAGGRGERLKPLTDSLPKPMAPADGRPFLDYLLKSLIDVGIEKVLILVGYKKESIINRYKKNSNNNFKIEFSIGLEEDNTGRRLLDAYNMLDDHFMLIYGDNYWPIELSKMMSLYKEKNKKILTTVFNNINGTGEYGKENNIEVDVNNIVKKYDNQRSCSKLNGVDIGYFIINKNILNQEQKGDLSFEQDILPEFVAKQEVIGYLTARQYYYITKIETLKMFELFIKERKKNVDCEFLSK